MRTELILSTYRAPSALRLALLSVLGQELRPDAVCVADDGSGPETKDVIAAMQAAHPELGLRQVWHPDRGFRKTAILNRAVASSEAEHLVFTDGDCMLAPGFVARHRSMAHRYRFCSGSLIRLPMPATRALQESDVLSGRVFTLDWLRQNGALDRATTWLKAGVCSEALSSALERAYPIRRTWMGSNASAFREAVLAVNGFDETMAWGGEDKEFGVRLGNSGVTGRSLRFTTQAVHLDHARAYRDGAAESRQRAMIEAARRSRATWTEAGIMPGPRPAQSGLPSQGAG